MKHEVQHLIHWSQWGRQWISHLRRNKGQPAARELERFDEAFAKIGREAAALLEKRSETAALTQLRARAEELQEQFHRFLRQFQPDEQQAIPVFYRKQSVPVYRPVPIGGHVLPPLPYDYDALEPHIDAETMRLHHDRHHQSYVDGLNRAERMMAQARETGDFSLIKHWEREAAFHGAGHYLHTIFWQVMSPRGGGQPDAELAEQIARDFGSFEHFQQHFSQAAQQVEGGGWAILVWSPRAQRLEILTAEKHQNLSQWDVIPLLVLDVWEHAYYLRYKNDRASYIKAWWNVVNWPHVQYRYQKARELRWQPF